MTADLGQGKVKLHDLLYSCGLKLGERVVILIVIVIVIVIGRNWRLSLGLFRTNFTFFFFLVRSDVSLYKVPQAATISPFLISPTHPTHTWRDRPQHGELRPLLFSDKYVISLLCPANHETLRVYWQSWRGDN